ncbi:MAG: hopanoid C-3 methylase HpnR [Acetobacteraceae bacterium]|nr:hopanoid C-3 methylase HpnR [Acetobacteraceae bacterium]
MRLLCVHPGPLMYTRVFLTLEPLGLELVAAAALRDGHDVRLLDLQVETHADYFAELAAFRPEVVAFSCNYLANVPEIVDLAKETKRLLPGCRVTVGGHSVSFTATTMLDHADGAIDCVLRGEGETALPAYLSAIAEGRALRTVPGAVTLAGSGPAPVFVDDLDALQPARHLLRHRRRYFIGTLDPCASIEFSRGCPWDCAFCSAWTFYGRSYRLRSPKRVAEDMAAIREPGVFIVDDVAFVREEHGMAIADEIERRGIRKTYYLETRADVLLRHKAVFARWRRLGLKLMFLGLEAIDDEGLKKFRKRVGLDQNFEALDYARSLGINVALNIIADPDWDHARFETVRQWCLEIPYVVNISVNTPYPGTETWLTEGRRLTSRDYRLFDIQHCVLPTKLPLEEFYRELVTTQLVLNRKHLGLRTLFEAAPVFARLLARGQTNFIRSMFAFRKVYNADALFTDHAKPVAYELPEPEPPRAVRDRAELYVHKAPARVRGG